MSRFWTDPCTNPSSIIIKVQNTLFLLPFYLILLTELLLTGVNLIIFLEISIQSVLSGLAEILVVILVEIVGNDISFTDFQGLNQIRIVILFSDFQTEILSKSTSIVVVYSYLFRSGTRRTRIFPSSRVRQSISSSVSSRTFFTSSNLIRPEKYSIVARIVIF